MKNQLDDEKMKDKFTEEDKAVITDSCKETLQWLENNQNGATEEYEAKQKELEAKFNPIMMRIYQATGQGGQGMPDMSGSGMGGGMGGMGGGMGGQTQGGNVDDLD